MSEVYARYPRNGKQLALLPRKWARLLEPLNDGLVNHAKTTSHALTRSVAASESYVLVG